ncbi:MAG: hypothetical protein QOH88_3038 [Verrucomicrobiota bacterium]|jgi:prepilin-type N-terminal cleavage/methylation domain-containing protein
MNRGIRAFTLVELLVAMAVTALLIALLLGVVSSVLNVWNQGRNRLDTFATARNVLSRLSDEITAAVVQKDKIEFQENVTLGTLPAPAPTQVEDVFFVASYPNFGAGDLCVIAYRLDTTTRELKRAFRNSDESWNVAPTTNRYKVASYDQATWQWRTVATGVLEFELRCYSQTDLDTDADPAPTWNSQAATVPAMYGKNPRRVVLRLKAVDDRTAVKLNLLTPGSAPYTQTVQQNAREFFADFSLPSR